MLAPGHLNIRIGRFRPISRAAFIDPARSSKNLISACEAAINMSPFGEA
jgi:hypothetical protein